MVSQAPLVSIIAVNFNQTAVTAAFLDSVRRLRYPSTEIILVDNGSAAPPGPWLQEHYPEVRYLETGRNLGFAGGNNVGIRAARGEYLLLVNNDTELEEDVVERLLACFEASEDVGMVCPLLLYHEAPGLVQYAGYTPLHPITARNRTIGQFEPDRGQFTEVRETPFAHGAAMLTSRKVLDRVGLMAEDYFLYYEELDWSARIRKAGYRILVEPRARVLHKESVSVGKDSPLKTYFMTRNRMLYMRRHASWWSCSAFMVYWFLLATPIHIARFLMQGKQRHLQAFRKAIGWHLRPRRAKTQEENPSIPAFLTQTA
jgi:GT2 family glycosyltransferase